MRDNSNNDFLLATPRLQEVEDAVFDINPNSAAGIDGFNGLCFQKTWDILAADIVNMVKSILNGEQLP